MCAILKDTDLDREQVAHLQSIIHSAESLLTVINDILDFSKIEAGKMSIENVAFDLQECVESALQVINFLAQKKRVTIQFNYALPKCQVHGDPTRIRQVMLNLVCYK